MHDQYMFRNWTLLSLAWYHNHKWNWWVLLLKGNPKQPLILDLTLIQRESSQSNAEVVAGTLFSWTCVEPCKVQPCLLDFGIMIQTCTGYLKAGDRQLQQETSRNKNDSILPACLFMEMVQGQKLGIFLNGEYQVLCIYVHALQKWP